MVLFTLYPILPFWTLPLNVELSIVEAGSMKSSWAVFILHTQMSLTSASLFVISEVGRAGVEGVLYWGKEGYFVGKRFTFLYNSPYAI